MKHRIFSMLSILTTGMTMLYGQQAPDVNTVLKNKLRIIDVKAFLAKAPDINAKTSKDGRTLLHWAAVYENPEVVKLLLADKRTDVNALDAYGYSPLIALFKPTKEEKQAHLIRSIMGLVNFSEEAEPAEAEGPLPEEGGAEVPEKRAEESPRAEPLFGLAQLVHMLLEAGAEPNIVDKEGNTALIYALIHGIIFQETTQTFDIVKDLLAHKADPNVADAKGKTALLYSLQLKDGGRVYNWLRGKGAIIRPEDKPKILFFAARQGNEAIMKKMITEGVDVNTPNSHGSNLLHIAAIRGDAGLIQSLLALKVNPKAVNNSGDTPLMNGVLSGRTDVLKLLLPLSDVNARNRNGDTALLLAETMFLKNYSSTYLENITLLLQARADANASNTAGDTPLSLVIKGIKKCNLPKCVDRYKMLIERLLQNGASKAIVIDGISPRDYLQAYRKSLSRLSFFLKKPIDDIIALL